MRSCPISRRCTYLSRSRSSYASRGTVWTTTDESIPWCIMKLLLLRLALLVRCAVNVVFACYLVATHPASISALARAFMPYAAADGVLALLLALLVLWAGWHAGIAMVAFVDGLIRAFAALVLWFGPGTPDFPLTAVLY